MKLGPVGLWTGALEALEVPAAREAVAELEDQGWDALWFGEAWGREAFTSAQLYLSACSRMVVGTGIASIYGRDAMAAAGAARLLAQAYPERFVLGLGVSHAPLVERMRGHAYGRPVAAMRDYLDALDGAPFLAAGSPELPPRVVAALGPKMLEVARDRAQGAHPYLVTPEHTASAREVLGPDPWLVVEQGVVLTDDEDEWRRRAHWHLEIYTGLPNYRANWLRQGMTEDDLGRGGSERLKQAMVPRGLEAGVARAREHLAAGATQVCLQVLGEGPGDVPRDDWRRFGEAVADLRG